MNAFMLWAKDKRSVLMSQGLTGATVSQVMLKKHKNPPQNYKIDLFFRFSLIDGSP